MITLFKGGSLCLPHEIIRSDLLCLGSRIGSIERIDQNVLAQLKVSFEELDCAGCVVTPGFIDCHAHLIGGSAEKSGLAHATPEIFFSEIVRGGTTTIVGTLGVDTTTKTMQALVAKTKALRQEGISAFCYTGGYDIPPTCLFKSPREDMIFIEEIIGIGEVAISDRRAIEPDIFALARAATDAHVCGLITGKAGVLHVHAGPGKDLLKPLHRLLDEFEIKPQTLYITHVERETALVDDGIKLSNRGCFIDFDVQEADLHKWYTYYREYGGRMENLTASSDSGATSPTDLHQQIQDCVLNHKVPLLEILPLVTENPARALRFNKKGRIEKNYDADLVVMDEKTLEIRHVVAQGQALMKDRKLVRKEAFLDGFRRSVDLHG